MHCACDSAYMIDRMLQHGPQRKSFSICKFGSSITGGDNFAHRVVLHVLSFSFFCPCGHDGSAFAGPVR